MILRLGHSMIPLSINIHMKKTFIFIAFISMFLISCSGVQRPVEYYSDTPKYDIIHRKYVPTHTNSNPSPVEANTLSKVKFNIIDILSNLNKAIQRAEAYKLKLCTNNDSCFPLADLKKINLYEDYINKSIGETNTMLDGLNDNNLHNAQKVIEYDNELVVILDNLLKNRQYDKSSQKKD